MIKVTLDTNCLIDIEERRKGYKNILYLKSLHDENKIILRVPAIIASEKRINKKPIKNFKQFEKFLSDIGFEEVSLLKPPLYLGITFWRHSIYSPKETIELEKKIHNILFEQIDFDYETYCKNNIDKKKEEKLKDKWQNAKFDELILWSHIYYDGDIFVSKDLNFHKETKKKSLIKLGAKRILKPKEAKKLLEQIFK